MAKEKRSWPPAKFKSARYWGHHPTQCADFIFVVKEYHDGRPWIAFEPGSQGLTSIKGSLGFDLKDGTTLEQAHEVARLLRQHIKALTQHVFVKQKYEGRDITTWPLLPWEKDIAIAAFIESRMPPSRKRKGIPKTLLLDAQKEFRLTARAIQRANHRGRTITKYMDEWRKNDSTT
jgi:hypothetical protein